MFSSRRNAKAAGVAVAITLTSLHSPGMTRVEVLRQMQAPANAVWSRLIDHENMADWAPIRSARLAREGSPDRNGPGAVRHIRSLGTTIEEEVTEWQPPSRYQYRLTRGVPIRNHSGEVAIEPRGDKCCVRWTVEFKPRVPGTGFLIGLALRLALGGMLKRLDRLAT
jgi:hypothetical protein